MKPAVEWVSSPSRPSDDLPSSRPARSSGSVHELQRRAEHELAGMQHERFPVDRFDQGGQLVLLLRRVDVGVLGVVEHPEEAVQANVDAGRLHQGVVERVDAQPAGGDFGPEVAIGEQHATSVSAWLRLAMLMNAVTPDASLPKHRADVVQWQNISFPS